MTREKGKIRCNTVREEKKLYIIREDIMKQSKII